MLNNLTQRLSQVVKTVRGQARITESNVSDMLREVRLALLEASCSSRISRIICSSTARRPAVSTSSTSTWWARA